MGGEVVIMLVLRENGRFVFTVNKQFYDLFGTTTDFVEYCTTHTVIDHAALQTDLLSSYLAVSMEDNSHLRQWPLPQQMLKY